MNTTGLGRLAVTSLAFAVLVMVPGLAAADDAADCAKETGDDAIAACTRRIESGEVKGHELAVMLDHRGLALRRKGDIDRAIADFDEAIRVDPNFAEPVFRRAMVWAYNRNDVERALTGLAQAVVLDPGSARAFFQRGLLYARKGDADRAIADFEETIRLDPNNADAFFQRGRVYGDKKRDYDRAIADFAEAFRLNPKFAAAINNRGFEYMLKGDLDHALADHGEAIRVDPNFASAYRQRAIVWSRKGDADKALADFADAIRLDPKDADAFLQRGRIYGDNKHDHDRAIADFSEAFRLNPKMAAALRYRGDEYRPKCQGIGYVTTNWNKPIAGSSITITFEIAATPGTVFGFKTERENTCATPANFRLLIERKNDELTEPSYRWWSNQINYPLQNTNGLVSLTVPLSGDNWSDVYGVTGAADPTGFAAALAHAGQVGMTFGGGCFFGHGAYVTSGTATLVLKSYIINP